jgi:inner membrane transporter RhtA
VLLVDPGSGTVDAVGFAVAAGACWMAYIYLSKRAGAAFEGGSGLALAIAVGALIVLSAGAVQAEGALPSRIFSPRCSSWRSPPRCCRTRSS